MTLRARLLLGIFFIAGVLVIPLWVALHSLEGLHEHAAEMLDYDFAASLLLGRIRVGTEDLRRAEDALLFVHDAASRDRVLREVSALQARADSLARFALDSAAVDVKNAVAEVAHLAPEEYTAAVAGKTKRADSLSAKGVRPALARIEASTMIAERALRDRTRQRVENASGEAEQARTLAIALLVFAAIVALTFALWLTRSVSKPGRVLVSTVGHAEPPRRVWPPLGQLLFHVSAAGRAGQAEGGICLRRLARAQDAGQRVARLSPIASGGRVRRSYGTTTGGLPNPRSPVYGAGTVGEA